LGIDFATPNGQPLRNPTTCGPIVKIGNCLPLLCLPFLLLGNSFAADDEAMPNRAQPSPKLTTDNNLQLFYQNLGQTDQIRWLEGPSGKFLALYKEQRTASPQGAALIVHDHGQTPDWPVILQEAREFLPDTGWSTLSISVPNQLNTPVPDRQWPPVPSPGSSEQDVSTQVMERIDTGLRELNSIGMFNIAFIGIGTGGAWITQYMAEQLQAENNAGFALIIVDTKLPANNPPVDVSTNLAALTVPILDLHFGRNDHEKFLARERKAAVLRKQREQYTQIVEVPPNIRFAQGPSRITRRVWGWLKINAAGREVDVKD